MSFLRVDAQAESFPVGDRVMRAKIHAPRAPWPILRAWGYNVPTDGTAAATIAANHDVVVLTKNDGRAAVATYRGLGVEVIQYILATEIRDNSTNNSVAWDNQDGSTYDIDVVGEVQPEWYLYTPLAAGGYGKIQTSANRFMNPANTDYQQWYVDRVRNLWTTRSEDWDGIFLDNIFRSLGTGSSGLKKKALDTTGDDGTGRIYTYDGSTYTQLTDNEAGNDTYRDGVVAFCAKIRTDLADHYGVPLWCNAVEKTSSYDSLADITPYFDGIMLERLWTDWPEDPDDGIQSNNWVSSTTWLADMADFATVRDAGVRVWAMGRGPLTDTDLLGFSTASFLLAYSHDDVFRYVENTRTVYFDDAIFDNAGRPLTNMYAVGDGSYRRDFRGGYVTVNPITHAYEINL